MRQACGEAENDKRMFAQRLHGVSFKKTVACTPDSPLGHQNQPPDGSRPLMRRYVTRLP